MNNKKQTIFYTQAYNAEATIAEAIESILNQTYRDFIYYLVENGSTDNTRRIIEKYAKNDSRIIPKYYDENDPTRIIEFLRYIYSSHEDGYLALLDADDEYYPAFLEKMIAFMEENDLDVAACGSEFLYAHTGMPYATNYVIDEDIILYEDSFSKMFTQSMKFMLTYWGKLYDIAATRHCFLKPIDAIIKTVLVGGDTIYALNIFKHARRAGVLGSALHRYMITPGSGIHRFEYGRVLSNQLTFEAYVDYLNAKNAASEKNLALIYNVHLNAILATIYVALQSDAEPSLKLKTIHDIITLKSTQEAIHSNFDLNLPTVDYRSIAIDGLLSLSRGGDDETLDLAADTIVALPRPIDILSHARDMGWYNHELFMLMIKMLTRLEGEDERDQIISAITKLVSRFPILGDIGLSIISAFPRVSCLIMQEHYADALESFLAASDGIEIADSDAESYLLFAQNLSAAADNTGAYIYFKKLWLSYLLDCSKISDAKPEIDDFFKLFPDDEDFRNLRERLYAMADTEI